MASIPAPSVTVSQIGRAAHDLGLAGLLGGTLFGRMALHPAVGAIGDPAQRGEVVNAAWRRYGAVNALGLAAVTAGWAGARAAEASDSNLTSAERRLARAKDGLVAALVATGVASALTGMRFARSVPHGAVPLTDGDHAAPQAPQDAGRLKRALNGLGLATLGIEAALVSVNAALAQEGFRRPAPRRRLWPGSR